MIGGGRAGKGRSGNRGEETRDQRATSRDFSSIKRKNKRDKTHVETM